ncbi:RHS repeat-associated core domain-containing protein [Caenimonas koreensis]|uniref:RHS repeat-associated core domain-containing protein n=1 Tax=Caenimonas koreensis TaxID=367474 RepID=UPI001890064F|nr:RHS repeat-associated core domain-containing protein [Caenimonas koreensis]
MSSCSVGAATQIDGDYAASQCQCIRTGLVTGEVRTTFMNWTVNGPYCQNPQPGPNDGPSWPLRSREDATGKTVCLTPLTSISITGPAAARTGQIVRFNARLTNYASVPAGVAINVTAPGASTASGQADATGNFSFLMKMPPKGGTLTLTGQCSGCGAPATKKVALAAPIDNSCPVGNPVSPATGQKTQDEEDWRDAGENPLRLTRFYRSYGAPPAGFGPNWSHDYAARIVASGAGMSVELGDGATYIFSLDSAGVWRSDTSADQLTAIGNTMQFTRAGDDTRMLFQTSTGRLLSITQRNGWTTTAQYNAFGLASVTNAFGRAITFSRTSLGYITAVTLPDGRVIRYAYTGAMLGRVTYADNTARNYLYEDARWPDALTGINDELNNRFATYTYDAMGRAASTAHIGNVDSYTFTYSDGAGQATQVIDPLGTQRNYQYQNDSGTVQLAASNGPFDGRGIASQTFGEGNLPSSETDFTGTQTAYTWDASRKLVTAMTRAAGTPQAQTVSIQWHPAFALPALVTERGRTTAFTYDGVGNLLTQAVTDLATAQTRTWVWTYNSQNLADSMTQPNGVVWRYGYDSAGNRTSVKNPLGQETTYTFDGAGRPTSRTDPNGLQTGFAYDARGRLYSTVHNGEATTFTYTPTGQVASATLPNGYRIDYSYDAAHRLYYAADNRGAAVLYTLDSSGNRVGEQVSDINGTIALNTARVINALNQVAAIQGGQGQSTTFSYDANGEPKDTTDPLQHTTTQTLDALRRVRAVTLADGSSVNQSWNQLDQLTQVTDPKGVQTSYTRNAFGDVLAEASPDTGTYTYQRDSNGQITAVTDAKGNTRTIIRDAAGRPTEIRHDAQHVDAYVWDGDQTGYLRSIQDSSGNTIFQRDNEGRVLTKTQAVNDNPSSPSQYKLSYTYANGDLASVAYPSGLKVFYRRQAGRITSIDVQEPGGTIRKPKPVVSFVSALAHTALGQPQSWMWSNGDAANRVFDTDGRIVQSEVAYFNYDPASRLTDVVQNLWAGRTVPQSDGTTQTELYQTTLGWSAGYDSRNRLTSFSRPGSTATYSYDANSNRLSSVEKTTSDTDLNGDFDDVDLAKATGQNLTIDANSNKLLGFTQTVTTTNRGRTRSVVTSTVNYALDANGAMTTDGLRTFDYDATGRLAKVDVVNNGESAQVRYLHNALGQRVFKSVPEAEQTLPDAQTLSPGFLDWLKQNFKWLFNTTSTVTSVGTAYIYDEGGNLLGEYDNGSALGKGRTEYIWLPTDSGQSMPIGFYRNGKFFAVHTDHLGTPRLVTDEAKKPVWQLPYSAFGNNKPTGVLQATLKPTQALTNQPVLLKSTAAVEFNLRFPGQYFDAESNLNYNYFRTYAPGSGRYTQPDPIGLDGGWNRYLYGGGSPLVSTDPRGESPLAGASYGGRVGAAAGSLFGPIGTGVGLVVGAGVGAAIGWYVTGPMLQEKTPSTGNPGEWHTNPADGKPGNGQERLYGPNGNPEVDIDWHPDHGAGKPHGHNWDNGRRGPGVPLSPWPRDRVINGCPRP